MRLSPFLSRGRLDRFARSAPLLTNSGLESAVQEAIGLWRSAGVDANRLAMLTDIEVRVAQLSGALLGVASDSTHMMWIDRDAAGRGWSIAGEPNGVDLLTTLTHEFGHILGLDHDVLGETLGVGQRQLPLSWPVVGDANWDGVFNELDVIQVVQSGKYLRAGYALWSEGDWTGDGRFDQRDIVAALESGRYRHQNEADADLSHELYDAVYSEFGPHE
jgi:hypothetical protein